MSSAPRPVPLPGAATATFAADLLERHYRVPEVAALFDLKPAAVWKLCRNKELGHVRIGNSIRIPASSVKAFLDKRQVKAER